MYAEQRYQPPQSRTAGLGGALVISGAFVSVMMMMAPNIMPVEKERTLIGENIPITPPPEPEPLPKPKVEDKPISQAPDPYAPDPLVRTDTRSEITTTSEMPTDLTPPITPERVGEPVMPEPPKPVPPLIGASQDPRFARDFQPSYPAAELRAQRSGLVSLRVLIGADGRVKAVEQLSATSAAFFEAARKQALAKWRFKPASRGGVPEESWKQMSVRFNIEDQ